jgi:hypothetical protein
MRINSLNYNPTSGVVRVGYSTRENDGKDKVTSECLSSDAPHPDLVAALAVLEPVVEEMCELPYSFLDVVRGFHLKRSADDEDELTVIFTATKSVAASKGPMVVNTPLYLPEEDERESIIACMKEARAYIEGKRAQGDLPAGDKKPSKKKGGGKQQKLMDTEPVADVEEPDDELIEEVREDPADRPKKRIYPAEAEGQIYKSTTAKGNTCTVKEQPGGWFGRWSGKPIARDQKSSSAAMRLVDEHTKESLDWQPTLDLTPDGEDLTSGL